MPAFYVVGHWDLPARSFTCQQADPSQLQLCRLGHWRIAPCRLGTACRRASAAAAAASQAPGRGGLPSFEPLVPPEWVQRRLGDMSLLDCRGRVDTRLVEPGVESSAYVAECDTYLAGHVPGAAFWDWTHDGCWPGGQPPVQLQTDGDVFAAEAEAKGVGTDRPVVVSRACRRPGLLVCLYRVCELDLYPTNPLIPSHQADT